jgi:hypothetical protein
VYDIVLRFMLSVVSRVIVEQQELESLIGLGNQIMMLQRMYDQTAEPILRRLLAG